MAKFIYDKMKEKLQNQYKNAFVSKVAVWETSTSRAVYFEE